MIFTCDNCGFIVSRTEEIDQCPDCGKHMVRPASEAEQEEFAARMAELTQSERSEAIAMGTSFCVQSGGWGGAKTDSPGR